MTKRIAGEGTVRHRSDGRWEARIRLPDGRRKSVFAATADECNAKRLDMLTAIRGGLPIPAERITVEEFLTTWLDIHKASVRPATHATYAGLLRKHVIPAIGRIRLARLSSREVQGMIGKLSEQGLSPKTVCLTRTIVNTAMKRAVEWGDIPRNPVTATRPPRVEHRPVDPWSAEECEQFLAGIRGERLEPLFVTAIMLGMRQGELCGLRWSDVDLDRGELRVMQARSPLTGEMAPPKSRRGQRTIALPEMVVAALRDHRHRQRQERLVMGPEWTDTGLVFVTGYGKPLTGAVVARWFRKRAAKLGLRRTKFHSLRHSCASLLVSRGVGLREIMELLGHSSIAITADTYSHIMPAVRRETANQMDAIFRQAQ